MSNGKVIFPSGDPNAITYQFPKNYDFGHNPGIYIDTEDYQRAFDGTDNNFSGAAKKKFSLTFTRVFKAQKDYFNTLYNFKCDLDLYLDGDSLIPDAIVRMRPPPEPKSEPAFDDFGIETYSFDVSFEEI